MLCTAVRTASKTVRLLQTCAFDTVRADLRGPRLTRNEKDTIVEQSVHCTVAGSLGYAGSGRNIEPDVWDHSRQCLQTLRRAKHIINSVSSCA